MRTYHNLYVCHVNEELCAEGVWRHVEWPAHTPSRAVPLAVRNGERTRPLVGPGAMLAFAAAAAETSSG
eukprot:scaffold4722_cov417-Prasinococcus_capsulatus_cf.AAC.3